jgi:hypothetical protein
MVRFCASKFVLFLLAYGVEQWFSTFFTRGTGVEHME